MLMYVQEHTLLINVANKCPKKVKSMMLEAILEHNVHVWVPIMSIFEDQMCLFGYLN